MVNDRSQISYFLHADGDSFFVACELSQKPELRGKPVVVGEDRGIAVAMSYEAKKLGVTRGMPVFKIKKLFPEVIILPHHFDLYRKISDGVYQILLSYLDEVEEYSIDECFAKVEPKDLTYFGGAEKLLKEIQDEIWITFAVTYSFGLGRTKALAKTASKLRKPKGLVALLSEEDELRALEDSSIDDIWGIGWRTFPRLKKLGMKNALDFVRYPTEELERFFSEPLVVLQRELRGESVHELVTNSDPRDQKSIQSTATFKPTSDDPKIIWAELADNAENACEHARRIDLMTNHVSFFVKTDKFLYRGSDAHLPLYTDSSAPILNALEEEFKRILKRGEKIRSTGIMLHNLRRAEDVPDDLFGNQQKENTRRRINKATDAIRKKFGWEAIRPAAALKGGKKERGNSFPGTS